MLKTITQFTCQTQYYLLPLSYVLSLYGPGDTVRSYDRCTKHIHQYSHKIQIVIICHHYILAPEVDRFV